MRLFYWVLLGWILSGCGGADAPGPREEVSLSPTCLSSSRATPDSVITSVDGNGYTVISSDEWDNVAVRQVLHAFAFGGFATDAQIQAWADMDPQEAIVQIISLETVNELVSPGESGDVMASYNSTLGCMSSLWSSAHRDNNVLVSERTAYHRDEWNGAAATFLTLSSLRGANPVRQRVGLWETNYHMVANMDVDVSGRQMVQYYDEIMDNLAQGMSYQEVMREASLSPAIATQYGHRYNVFQNGEFAGNEDFAREYHQLFFGILGFSPTDDYTFAEHETVTIPQTARALTDMLVPQVTIAGGDTVADASITYGTDFHYTSSVTVLGESFSGNTAEEKVTAISEHAITTSESEQNLPTMIIEHFADNALTDSKKTQLTTLWLATDYNLLEFLRKYAISDLFHDSERVKYWSPIERNLLYTNLSVAENYEIYQNLYLPFWTLALEDSVVFRPRHNVFGATTGLEAASTPSTFKSNFRRSVDRYWLYGRTYDPDRGWDKKWETLIPEDSNGQYNVVHVAEWLWSRLIADGLDNFGPLERAHVYALLASGTDLGLYLDADNPDIAPTESELETALASSSATYGAEMANLVASRVLLDSEDENNLRVANYRIGQAINFITATPYAFGQQGR